MDRVTRQAIYEFGEFRLNVAQQLFARTDGSRIALPSRAFDVLVYLVERAGEVVDKSALMKAVWPNVVVDENNLSQHLSTLRKVLGDAGRDSRYIVTIPGRGFRFTAAVTRAGTEAPAAETSPPPQASVAVLPFVHLGDDPQKEHFGDGMAEELIYLLSRVPGLSVPARTSSFAYKSRSVHVREIGRDLGVHAVLEGSIRSDGNRIRITAQLVSAATGYHLWSQSFDRDFDDIFRLQDEIANAIVQSLRGHVGATPPSPWRPTANLEAYQLYLQGISVGRLGGERNTLRGLELLEAAVQLDPAFARAHAAIASLRSALVFYGRPESVERAKRDALRALAVDPDIAEAREVLGIVNVIRREWLDADENFRKAARPKDGAGSSFYFAVYLTASAGHVRKTRAILLAEHKAAPAVPLVIATLAAAHIGAPLDEHATPEALRLAQLALDLGVPKNAGPLPAIFSYGALRLGNEQGALDAGEIFVGRLREGMQRAGSEDLIRLVHAHLANRASTPSPRAALEELMLSLPAEDIGPEFGVHMLAWCTMLGGLDCAHAFANRMLDFGIRSGTMGIFLNWIWIPELLPFRRDARFQAFAERVGLMEYWARFGPPDDCEIQDGKLIVR
jgi:TolB-like protein